MKGDQISIYELRIRQSTEEKLPLHQNNREYMFLVRVLNHATAKQTLTTALN